MSVNLFRAKLNQRENFDWKYIISCDDGNPVGYIMKKYDLGGCYSTIPIFKFQYRNYKNKWLLKFDLHEVHINNGKNYHAHVEMDDKVCDLRDLDIEDNMTIVDNLVFAKIHKLHIDTRGTVGIGTACPTNLYINATDNTGTWSISSDGTNSNHWGRNF